MSAVFHYSNPPTIHWGAGALARLGEELDRLDVQRPFLVTTRSVAGNGELMSALKKQAGRDLAGSFAGIGQHAPQESVEAATEEARQASADGIVSLGGGSPIDAAKIVALDCGRLAHVAIPTTLSAAELSPAAGVTDERGQKVGRRGADLIPGVVIYDAELTLHTPLDLWLSTGIRALDHAVEAILADRQHPFSDTMSLEAIRRLFTSLPQAKAAPWDLAVRTENQLGAWFSFTLPLASAGGLSHMLGKQIGSPFGIPHGVTSCLLLPHVMRYLARTKAEKLACMAPATGVPLDGRTDHALAMAAADAVQRLIGELGQPQRLADYHLSDDQLRAAAEPLAGAAYHLDDLVAIYQAAR